MGAVQIIGIGANVFDTLIRTDSLPREDTKKPAMEIRECGGGPCGTGLVAAAKLGASCAYIGNYSDDLGGKFLVGDFQRFGVDTSHMTLFEGKRSFASCIWLADDNASRTCLFHRGNLPPVTLTEEDKRAIEEAEVLLLDGNGLECSIEAARIARNAGTTVLLDAGRYFDGMETLLELTDLLIPSEEFALEHSKKATAEEAARALMERYHPTAVVITQGKEGGILLYNEELISYPAFPVEAVDTNGSGDVFHGAFAFATTKKMEMLQRCLFSSAVSALKCTKVGSRDAVPTYEETLRFLSERGCDLNLR